MNKAVLLGTILSAGLALVASAAGAKTKKKEGAPGTPPPPDVSPPPSPAAVAAAAAKPPAARTDLEWQELVAAAIAKNDTKAMRKLAAELEQAGKHTEAQQLLQLAQQMEVSPPPTAPTPSAPTPSAPTTWEPEPSHPAAHGPGTAPATAPPPEVHDQPPQPPPAPPGRTYTVQKGDSSWKITQLFTGDGNRWKELVKANPGIKKGKDGNFANIWPGLHLELPSNWPAEPHGGAAPAPPLPPDAIPAPPAVAAPPAAPTSVAPTGSVYVVKKGDSAWKITQLITGNGNRWKELVAANPQKKKNPKDGNFATLAAGEHLHVPSSWPASTLTVVEGIDEDEISAADNNRVLAARLALHLRHRNKGREDRQLIRAWQQARGICEHGACTGLYDIPTAESIANLGIVPPTPFYWPHEGAPEAKKRYRDFLLSKARGESDPECARAWQEAAGRVKV
jgi:nucleoid-associated protein YgaU